MISRAVTEGRIRLDDTIDAYLPLPEGKSYPTITELLTHTSGYSAYYFSTPMIGNFFAGRNSFNGISRDMVLTKSVPSSSLLLNSQQHLQIRLQCLHDMELLRIL